MAKWFHVITWFRNENVSITECAESRWNWTLVFSSSNRPSLLERQASRLLWWTGQPWTTRNWWVCGNCCFSVQLPCWQSVDVYSLHGQVPLTGQAEGKFRVASWVKEHFVFALLEKEYGNFRHSENTQTDTKNCLLNLCCCKFFFFFYSCQILLNCTLSSISYQFRDDYFILQHGCTPIHKTKSIRTQVTKFGVCPLIVDLN